MRERVQPRQTQKLLGPQPGLAPQPQLQKVGAQPARLGNRGQHQGVDPHGKARAQAHQRPQLGATFPENAAEQCRSKLRHGGKADEANADQRIGLARQVVVHIAQNQHTQNGSPPDAQQHARDVASRGQLLLAPTQHQGQHQLVADHGRHRDGLHNHHAGGGRQTAYESQHGQRVLAIGQGQREHKVFGVHVARLKVQQAPQRDRQHKQVDQQHVQRKHPQRPAQVRLAHVLDHHDLKLPGQHQDREHGQQGQRKPLRPHARAPQIDAEQLLRLRHCGGAGKHIAQAIKQAPHHKAPHRQKGHQLDDRLEGNGRHHALVAFGAVQVPRTKHHGETRQHHGHIKSRVLRPVHIGREAAHVAAGQHGITSGHGLELQRDVGHDAHHRNQRDQPGQHRALAVAAANEVGDRGDAVGLGDAVHFAQHHPAQQHGQGRPEIDRQKPHAARSRAADAAKVGPCGAIHRHGQRVHPGVVNDRATQRRAAVGPIGHTKEQQQIAK